MFKSLGDNVFFQPRKLPTDPELISIANNIFVASDVTFVNHDIVSSMFNSTAHSTTKFDNFRGCIEIGNNVMIGANMMIMSNVKIGNDVVIGAGSIVTKDILNG